MIGKAEEGRGKESLVEIVRKYGNTQTEVLVNGVF